MDGTLLDSSLTIPPKNIEALEALREKDVGIVLATGRTELMTRKYTADLDLVLPIISNNGSLVVDVKTKKVLYRHTFPKPILERVLGYAIAKGMDYLIYTMNKVYYSANSRKIAIMRDYNSMVPIQEQIRLEALPGNLPDVLSMLPDGGENCAMKILISYLQDGESEFFKTMEGVEAIASMADAFDVMPAGGTKGKALEFLAGYLGVDRQNIFAFGDNCNDLTMLDYAAYALVPDNGVEEAKDIADFVTASNDEAGVAQGIYEFVMPKISWKTAGQDAGAPRAGRPRSI